MFRNKNKSAFEDHPGNPDTRWCGLYYQSPSNPDRDIFPITNIRYDYITGGSVRLTLGFDDYSLEHPEVYRPEVMEKKMGETACQTAKDILALIGSEEQ